MKTINQQAQVTKDDQKNINNFSKMYSRHQQIMKQLSELKQKLSKHDDTIGQLQLKQMQGQQDQIVRYRFGNCFFYLPIDQTTSLVQKDKLKVQKQLKDKQQQSDDNQKRMKKLKATLYSKFGNSINLQE